jgi:transcriptional regulator of arginine metabolism
MRVGCIVRGRRERGEGCVRLAAVRAMPVGCIAGRGRGTVNGTVKRDRQRAIRELVAREPIGSQQELAERLAARGYDVTQATVSRDIAELGLVKVLRGDRHVYVAPQDLAAPGPTASDGRLRRILQDIPVTVGRSGLVLVLTGTPGTASVVAQAIDDSTLTEQEGTLAGDNTLLVLFADEARLERWLARFRRIQSLPVPEEIG